MNVEDLLGRGGAGLDVAGPDEKPSMDAFTAACRRVDSDSKERQRIRDLADSIEAEDATYQQAMTALEEGDIATADPLLRRAASLGIGEADDLLADLLKQRMVGCRRAR
jgi:ferritin-like metal-binding protein YciE